MTPARLAWLVPHEVGGRAETRLQLTTQDVNLRLDVLQFCMVCHLRLREKGQATIRDSHGLTVAAAAQPQVEKEG
jgi:hypothetical protein